MKRKLLHFNRTWSLLTNTTIVATLLLMSGHVKAQYSLSTYPTTVANNGNAGISFELTTNRTIILQSLDAALNSSGSSTFDIYYRVGGVQSTPGMPPTIDSANGWVLLGDTSASGTSGAPIHIPLSLNLLLSPGTYGFYMNTSNVGYRSWVSGATDVFSDGIVTIETGQDKGYGGGAPNPTFHPRQFVGTVHYKLIAVPNEAGITSIVSPVSNCEGTHDVIAAVKNFGLNQINSVIIEWSINGVMQNSVLYSGLLDTLNGSGFDTAHIILGQIALNGGFTDTIEAWIAQVNLQADTVNVNDSAAKIIATIPTVNTFPYYEDFENGQADWKAGGVNSTWVFGTPAKTNIVGAASGINAFVNGGFTGNYVTDEYSHVESPCFDLTSFNETPWVAMDINWDTEGDYDGAVLQTTIDGGQSWQTVGDFGDPYNWYNYDVIFSNPGGQEQGWSGTGSNGSQGWKKARHALPSSYAGKQVQFRIAFGSDFLITNEGFAFDNFTLVDFKPADLGPDKVSLCGKTELELDPGIFFRGPIAWMSTDTILDTLNSTYDVIQTGTYWVVYTDTLIDITTSDTVEIVQSTPPNIQFSSLKDTIDVKGQITLDPQTPFGLNYHWTPGDFSFPYLLIKGQDYDTGVHVFHLTVTDSLYCRDQATVTVVIVDITGVDEHDLESIQFYPNPVVDKLNVLIPQPVSNSTGIRLYDVKGSLVYSNTFSVSQSSKLEVDMSMLTPGAYFIQVGTGQDMVVKKVIKH